MSVSAVGPVLLSSISRRASLMSMVGPSAPAAGISIATTAVPLAWWICSLPSDGISKLLSLAEPRDPL
jgi:hypothetical protein